VTQNLQEAQPVFVVQEDILAGVTTTGDVVHRATIFDA